MCSDTSSDGSDYTVVTPNSDAVVVTLYSVVTRFNSVYSVYSVLNHSDSLYSVVVRGLCELCVEFFIVYSVNQQ
jgi:ABC-type arginine transport system permease subunit